MKNREIVKWTALACLSFWTANSVHAATPRLFTGAAGTGDLTDANNWTGNQLPVPATDLARFNSVETSGDCSWIPDTGLFLSKDLMLGAVEFNYRKTVSFDLSGKTLSFPDDGLYTLNINNNVKMTMHNGVITNLSRLGVNIGTELNLTNVTVYLRTPYVSYRYNSALRVLKDASLIFLTEASSDQKFVLGENDPANSARKLFLVDGGRVVAKTAGGTEYRRNVIGGKTNCVWHIRNGGRYDDYSPRPCLLMNYGRSQLLVTDAGELTMTNAVAAGTGRESYIGLVLADGMKDGFVGVSNATLRTTRMNYLTENANACVFSDAIADFRYHGPDADASSTTNVSGFFFRNGSANGHVRVTGSESVFRADRLIFEDGSSGHVFEADGGELTVGLIRDAGTGNELSFSGCTLNGGVQLHGENGTVTFGDGAVCTMPTRDKGLQFANDVTAGSRLVISNAQIECQGAVCGHYNINTGGSIWETEASVYVNCPGSAIEFRGETPRLKITSSWSAPNSGYWFCAAFGSFAGGVLGTEPLSDPLTLRFVLPEAPYAEAPLQGAAQTTSGGRPVVLAGNARIEVLADDFKPSRNAYRMPLIRDINNFTQANAQNANGPFFMLDIDALNRNNADTLPPRSRLVYVQDGTAGRIDIVFSNSLVMTLR